MGRAPLTAGTPPRQTVQSGHGAPDTVDRTHDLTVFFITQLLTGFASSTLTLHVFLFR